MTRTTNSCGATRSPRRRRACATTSHVSTRTARTCKVSGKNFSSESEDMRSRASCACRRSRRQRLSGAVHWAWMRSTDARTTKDGALFPSRTARCLSTTRTARTSPSISSRIPRYPPDPQPWMPTSRVTRASSASRDQDLRTSRWRCQTRSASQRCSRRRRRFCGDTATLSSRCRCPRVEGACARMPARRVEIPLSCCRITSKIPRRRLRSCAEPYLVLRFCHSRCTMAKIVGPFRPRMSATCTSHARQRDPCFSATLVRTRAEHA
mmetsp:Transcript_4582/g.10427  ORF Transcript_4582/g.10427 Transcript_4582/m.10427 type:complete len:266 (-) Transcript_4582:234-1031(-)